MRVLQTAISYQVSSGSQSLMGLDPIALLKVISPTALYGKFKKIRTVEQELIHFKDTKAQYSPKDVINPISLGIVPVKEHPARFNLPAIYIHTHTHESQTHHHTKTIHLNNSLIAVSNPSSVGRVPPKPLFLLKVR